MHGEWLAFMQSEYNKLMGGRIDINSCLQVTYTNGETEGIA